MFEAIIIPVIVGFFTQALKLVTDKIPGNFTLEHFIGDYGGMPSSHTAFVASLATVIGLRDGFNSSAFAVALILLVVVIRDAVGFRREIGRNATLTNKIGKEVFKNKSIKYLNEQMGHTVPQVSAGLIVGVITTVVIYVLIKNYFPL